MQRWTKLDNIIIQSAFRHLSLYPTGANLSYFWGFGALAGIFLVVQIFTGILLAMHYTPNSTMAFQSVEHIMRDLNSGWLFRYFHANGASFFFIAIYTHIIRGFFYRSYVSTPLLWHTGIIILVLTMAAAFMGYILPWGQMSFWGATVITNIFSALPKIGQRIVEWLWGGFAVDNPTLNRFFSLHYLVPFIIVGVVILHIIILHIHGSNNPLGVRNKFIGRKIPFYPYFVVKDLQGLALFVTCYIFITYFYSNLLGHPDNYEFANCSVTPSHIVPEWYFLPFYAILRACPHKIGGILGMAFAILILFFLPLLDRPFMTLLMSGSFWMYYSSSFFVTLLILGWLGSQPAHSAYTFVSKFCSVFYFACIGTLPITNYLRSLSFNIFMLFSNLWLYQKQKRQLVYNNER